MEGALVSLWGKAQPMLPGKVNGQPFVNDRVSSVPFDHLLRQLLLSNAYLQRERQGRPTLLDDLLSSEISRLTG